MEVTDEDEMDSEETVSIPDQGDRGREEQDEDEVCVCVRVHKREHGLSLYRYLCEYMYCYICNYIISVMKSCQYHCT